MTRNVPSTAHRISSALGALLVAAFLIVGVPLLLWKLAGWPLPHAVPSIGQIGRSFSRSSISDDVIIKALALVGWGVWLILSSSLIIETWAWVRGRAARQITFAGPLQALARQLVTTASLLLATGMSSAHPSFAVASVGTPTTVAVANRPARTPSVAAASIAADASTIAQPAVVPTYTVQRGDSLWRIADRCLGDPMRWRELWMLNQGRDFGGVTFADPNLIYSGWELHVPAPLATAPTALNSTPAPVTSAPEVKPPEPTTSEPTSPTSTEPSSTTTVVIRDGESSDWLALSAPPTATTSTPNSGVSPSPVDDEEDSRETNGALFAGGVALASALVLLLTRLRRSQLRRRRPGLRPHRPSPGTADIETAVRRDADTSRMDRLDAALRAFASGVGGERLPELAAVRVGPEEVEILVGSAVERIPPGFEERGERRSFATEANLSHDALTGLAADVAPPWPTVVTAGSLAGDLVLIDLETAGMFTVQGRGATETVRRMAAELAATPISDLIEILAVGDELELAGCDRIRSAGGIDQALDSLERTARETKAALDRLGDPDTPTARRSHSGEHGWGVTVLVSENPLDEAARERLSRLAARCGVAALVVGEPFGTAWSLAVDDTSILSPHGFELDPLPLSQRELQEVDALLVDAAMGDVEDALLPPDDDESEGSPIHLSADQDRDALPEEFDVEVRVLGPVDVHGVEPINRRRSVEIIAYLALHPGGTTSSRIKTAIWPEAVPAQGTFNSTIYRTRIGLGVDRDGNHNLPHAVNSGRGYRLGPRVTSDLDRFTDLVRQSREADHAHEEANLLRCAISLLRGPPFESTIGYEWAYTEGIVAEAEATIADTAHRLAQLALADGDHQQATWAATRGLDAVPGTEPLYRDRMEAAYLAGDPAGVDRIVEELCRYVETLDPLDDLHPETIDLWHRLGRAQHGGPEE